MRKQGLALYKIPRICWIFVYAKTAITFLILYSINSLILEDTSPKFWQNQNSKNIG